MKGRTIRCIKVVISAFLLIPSLVIANDIQEICYVPIGDSYTIGTGALPHQSWPAVVTRELQQEGIHIRLVANPAKAGRTTQEAIHEQLPFLKVLKPDFTTLLIGVNDWVQGIDAQTFRSNLQILLDEMTTQLPQKDHILVLTIPDFSVMPRGKEFAHRQDIRSGLQEFNAIIKEEAAKRSLPVLDLFSLSQKMKRNPSLISSDGLHPSAQGYALWAEWIYPEVRKILKQ